MLKALWARLWHRSAEHPKQTEEISGQNRPAENDSDHAAAIREVKTAYVDAHKNDGRRELFRSAREWATVALLIVTAGFTGLTYFTFNRQIDLSHQDEVNAVDAAINATNQARSESNDALDQSRIISDQDSALSIKEASNALSIAEKSAGAAEVAGYAARDQAKISGRTLIEGNRAWLEPEEITLVPTPDAKNVFQLEIKSFDAGHGPAIDVKWFVEDPKVLPVDLADPDAAIDVGPNPTCEEARKTKTTFVTYPGGYRLTRSTLSIFSDVGPYDTLVVRGCFVYKTFGVEHKAAFCSFTLPSADPLEKRRFQFCAQGNDAD